MSNLKKPARKYLRYRKVVEWTLKELGLQGKKFDIILLDTPEFVVLYNVFILLQSSESKKITEAGNMREYGVPYLPHVSSTDAIMLANREESPTAYDKIIADLKEQGGNLFKPKLPSKSIETIIQFYEMIKNKDFMIAVNKPVMNLPDYNEAKKKQVIIHEVLDYRDFLCMHAVPYDEQDWKARELYEKYRDEIL